MRVYPQTKSGSVMTQFHQLSYTVDHGVATITINRPNKLNSLCLEVFREMRSAVLQGGADDSVGVIVITGAGERAFCAGADVDEHLELSRRPRDYTTWIREFVDMQTTILRSPKPTIARLNGAVVAAGNELNVACDLAVAAEHVTVSQAGPSRGSAPAIGVTQWMPLISGDRRTRELVMTCEPIDAQRAYEWGLINRVVPKEDLDAEVRSLADTLLNKFPESLRYSKTSLNQAKEEAWAASVPHAGDWLSIHAGSVETYEGMGSFKEKRPTELQDHRERGTLDRSPEFQYGPPIRCCAMCGATKLAEHHGFCGECGSKLAGEDQ